MSRDQRPGRVKMIDDAVPPTPARRAGDLAPTDLAGASPDATPMQTATDTGSGLGVAMWTGLFLVACVAGAAGVALLPMLGAR